MTVINPTYKQPGRQTLETLLAALKYDILKNINCCKVGVIQSYDSALQEATIKIAFEQVTSTSPEGVQTIASYPILLNVPCYYTSGGGFTLTFPIVEGDECIVLFNDRQLDNWLLNGAGLPPSIGRVHDLSDGIALVGLRNNTRALTGISTDSAQLRSDDGATFIEVKAGGIVNITAPTTINMTSPTINLSASTEINLDSPQTNITGVITGENLGGSSTPFTLNGNVRIIGGGIISDGDIVGNGISLDSHKHTGVTTGGGDTGGPI